jgi:hypothetical protein
MAIILNKEEENQPHIKTWAREILMKRKQFGEYHILFNNLEDFIQNYRIYSD